MQFDLIEHTHRLARALLATEMQGIRLDLEYCLSLGSELTGKLSDLSNTMHESVIDEIKEVEEDIYQTELGKRKTDKGKANVKRPTFNFSSSTQLGKLLYAKLKLPPKRTKKGTWTTSKLYLETIAHHHPVVAHISERNKLNVYYQTFVKGLMEKAIGDRIYPEFNVNGTKQARISHSNPNMGNQPSRGEWSKLRGIFLPDQDQLLFKSDYSQLEVYIATHFSQDKNLLRVIHEGESKHDITAKELGIERADAKTVNFAMQYGCTPTRIQLILKCSREQAQNFWDRYWIAYPGEKVVIDRCKKLVDDCEPIVNPFGRARHLPTQFRTPYEKAAVYRQAYSHLIQSTAGDLMNLAFYEMSEWTKKMGYGRMLFTVHDEGIGTAKPEHQEECLAKLNEFMINAGKRINLTVDLSTDGECGLERWKK